MTNVNETSLTKEELIVFFGFSNLKIILNYYLQKTIIFIIYIYICLCIYGLNVLGVVVVVDVLNYILFL
jgi:hypothetical protein